MANTPADDKKDIIKLAHIYAQEGQWDRALNEYRKILAIDPEDMNTHSTLGDIYVKKDLPQAAYEAYNRAITGYLQRSQTDKAINLYKKLVRLNTSKLMEEARAKIAFAALYVKLDDDLKMEKLEDAIETMGKLLKARADDPVVKSKLVELELMIAELPPSVLQFQTFGDLFLKHNILDKAQVMFKKVSELDTKDRSVRANMAQLFVKKGSESEAKKEYLALAEEAMAENKLDEAMQFTQKALELKSVEAHFVAGIIFFKQRKWAEAKNEFEQLLRLKVNHLSALIHMGKALDELNQPDKAKEFFHKALMVDKENVLAQEAWAEFCVKRQDKETAIPNLTVLLDKAVLEKDPERSIKFARLLTQIDPELIFPHAKLIQLLQAAGNDHEAAEACCVLAKVYQKSGQFQGAMEYLEKALDLAPEMAETLQDILHEIRLKLEPEPAPIEVSNEVQQVLIAVSEEKPMSPLMAPEPVLESTETVEVTAEPTVIASVPPMVVEAAVPEPGSALPIEPEEENGQLFAAEVIPMMPDPLEAYSAELGTAEMCIKQGLLKAAIDIYHQLLDADPSLEGVRKKLNDVNALYLKKWMEAKVIKAPIQPNPFLIAPPSVEKKSNTNR